MLKNKQNSFLSPLTHKTRFYLLHFDILVTRKLQTGTSALIACRWRYERGNEALLE